MTSSSGIFRPLGHHFVEYADPSGMSHSLYFSSLQGPIVVEKPHDVTVKEGESARFTCRLLGMPTPAITWFFMGKPIMEDEIYKLEQQEGGWYTLFLPEAFPEDAGVYTIRGNNEHGIVEATCILTVEGLCMAFIGVSPMVQ